MGKFMEEFPLHWHVWHNEVTELRKELARLEHDLNEIGPRGRTPLHLAVTLGHLESVKVLLQFNADVNIENKKGWNVVQEAISTGDPELVQLILQHRDFQRAASRIGGIPELLEKLRQAPDFYVEMKWEFTSWVPLMSRLCPHDTYKVYKSGPNVRIDTTLIGFDNMNWIRGNRSYIFRNHEDNKFQFIEIDHDAEMAFSEVLEVQPYHDLARMTPSEDAIAARLTSPITTTYIDTDKIEFSRSKAGIWGWRHDKVEVINDYECKVFSASNVQLVTKTRTEHLTKEDKERNKADGAPFASPLQSLLGAAEQHEEKPEEPVVNEEATFTNPTAIKPEEYFNKHIVLENRDVGRPKEVSSKIQKFRATLWLSENHPLSMQEQVLPIIDLMAISNAHFAKLRDFIMLQLPAGFPIKIEIPLFHILNACVTFGNLNTCDTPVKGVSNIVMEDLSKNAEENGDQDDASAEENTATPMMKAPLSTCVVESDVFDIPENYVHTQAGSQQRVRYSDDELLQMAILRSQVEGGSQDSGDYMVHGNNFLTEEEMLERAIQESIFAQTANGNIPNQVQGNPSTEESTSVQNRQLPPLPSPVGLVGPSTDEDLRLALAMSQDQLKQEEQLRKQEEEELQKILELSLSEK
ncbi:ankyrin repeat domain-containing protein 13D-like isoform X3 [Apostichopus japonicus]|uniref:ankyrin repeat domain-containing protein 13D-like isoform X3 n=1 Tax=Stichopus japonicus TaxID=307972 RepID=UPI003AB7ECA8